MKTAVASSHSKLHHNLQLINRRLISSSPHACPGIKYRGQINRTCRWNNPRFKTVAAASGPVVDFASLGLDDLDIPDIDGDLKSVQTELGATFDVRFSIRTQDCERTDVIPSLALE